MHPPHPVLRSFRLARCICILLILLVSQAIPARAQRQMERLGRGVIAIKTSSTQVYVGWRLLGNDPEDVAFNLYRSANGAAAVKVNTNPITATTDYVDTPGALATTAYTYSVKPVLDGVEVPDTWANLASGPYTLPANSPTRQYVSVPMQPTPDDAGAGVSYDVKFCWVGDFDGDGEYDFVVDRTNPSVEARQWLQAYKRDGTLLWQMNMGPNSVNHYNIEPGSSSIGIGHGDNVTAYDLDGDGKAEVIVRTANGVTFADGTTLTAASDVTQYISILDGMTGKEKARATIPNPWPGEGQMNGHMGIVYADGMKPSVFWQSSNRNADNSFNDIATTWDYRNGVISQRWSWPFTGHTATAHQIRLADVDNDGKDEYLDIGLVLKADGSAQINGGTLNEVVHGDRFHVTDIDPDRPGLETFLIQQNNGTGLATVYQAADKNAVLKKWYAGGVVDVGRGVVADVNSASKGCEFFSTQPGTFDAKGNQLYAANPFPPETIWWDADLAREFVATVGSTSQSPAISKFNNNDPGNPSRIYTIYNETAPGVYQAYGGRPQFWGDLFGDWREEYLCVANGNSEMRIYTTKIAAANRLYTLMHNPQYRIQTTTKGYVQSSYVDYYLGYGMTPPPPPPMVDAKLVWRGGTGATTWNAGTTASWLNTGVNSTYANGDTVRFDISGNNTTTVALNGTLQPGAVTVYSPKDYTFDGTSGSIAGATKLVKAGAGILTVSGAHTFTGKTTVWDGALNVNGDLQGSPVTVWGGTWGGALAAGATGGRVGGTGRFSQPVTVKYRGAVTPGAGMNSVGTVTFGAGLTAEDGSVLAFDLSNTPATPTSSDRIAVTGNLAVSGKVAIVVKALNGQLAAGTYNLLTYTGALTGSASNFAVTLPPGIPYTLNASSGVVSLTVPVTRAAANVVWRGSGTAWDLATTQNWLRAAAPDIFVAGDTVSFDTTGAATPTATLATVLPVGGVTVNADTDYTLTGAGSISGSGGLTKSGAGTLTINTINDYTGATVINGGVVAVASLNDGGSPGSLGAASTSASNLVINGGTLRLTGSQTNTNRSLTLGASGATFDVAASNSSLQISGAATGTGSLTKSGPGTLILASANTYSGGTILNGGTIYLAGSTPNTSGLGTGTVTINSGTLTMSDVQASETAAWNLIVPTGATARLNSDGRCTLTGSLTGGGTFNFWTGYVRTDLKGNWSAFTGRINVISDSAGGDFRVTNTTGYGGAALNLGDLIYAYYNNTNSTATIDIGELSGVATSSLSGTPTSGRTVTWRIGGKNTDSTFAGVITNGTGPAAITKIGTGALTLDPSDALSVPFTLVAGSTTATVVSTTAAPASTAGLLAYMPVTGTGIPAGTYIAAVVDAATITLSQPATASSASTTLACTTISTYTGPTIVTGGTLIVNRVVVGTAVTVQTGSTLSGRGNIVGNVTINAGGTLATGTGGSLKITGNLTNNGTVRITGGGLAAITGTFTNKGVLDLITAVQTLPPGFVNQGTVLDSSVIKVKSLTTVGSDVNLTIQSYLGHNYQLQKRASLTSGTWTDVAGASQAGTGGILTLTETGGASTSQGYYRVVISP